jgi:hypothetical protein
MYVGNVTSISEVHAAYILWAGVYSGTDFSKDYLKFGMIN